MPEKKTKLNSQVLIQVSKNLGVYCSFLIAHKEMQEYQGFMCDSFESTVLTFASALQVLVPGGSPLPSFLPCFLPPFLLLTLPSLLPPSLSSFLPSKEKGCNHTGIETMQAKAVY